MNVRKPADNKLITAVILSCFVNFIVSILICVAKRAAKIEKSYTTKTNDV